MPPKAKEAASAHAKKVEDKTFGMKNKNKSKQVQAKIQQMHKGGGNNPEADQYDKKARPFAAHPRVRLRPSSRAVSAGCSAVAEEGAAEGCRGRAGHGPLQGGQEEERDQEGRRGGVPGEGEGQGAREARHPRRPSGAEAARRCAAAPRPELAARALATK